MDHVLHRSTTTETIGRTIQHSQESMRSLAHRHGKAVVMMDGCGNACWSWRGNILCSAIGGCSRLPHEPILQHTTHTLLDYEASIEHSDERPSGSSLKNYLLVTNSFHRFQTDGQPIEISQLPQPMDHAALTSS